MTNNQDARPFVDLRKDAEEFRMKFDEDINDCLSFLDVKIKTLICDPDSFGTAGRSIHQNALAEFSKAKYDIFIGVKSRINAKEREWLDYIAEMKKLFVENVEIFLAGTKLEVKLPPSESVSSRVLGSSFHEKDSSGTVSKAYVGEKTQFNRRGKLSTSSIKLANSPYDDEEEMDMEEPELDRSRSRSSSNTRSRKSSNSGLNTSRSSSGRRSSLKKENDLGSNENISVLLSQTDVNTTVPVNINNLPPKMRGQRGKLIEVNSSMENVSLDIKKVRGKQQTVKSKKVQNSSSDENESQITKITEKEMPLKGRRGRSAPKAKLNDMSVVAKSSSSNTDEEDNETETIENEVPLKGHKGKSASKAKANDLTVVAKSSSNTDEEDNQTETIENKLPLKGRKGRLAPKAKVLSVVAKNSSSTSTDENENQTIETVEDEVPLKGRRGRSAPKSKANDLIVEENMNKQVRGGRSTTAKSISDQTAAKKITIRGRKAVQRAIDEEMYEPGPSKSPKKVSFGGDHSSSDELDIQTPLARPVKSAARRKTLLPNLEHLSDADIIPGNPSRSKAKRKTISNASELETVAPSKRLKVSQKSISVQEEDYSTNDNLLESDGNYSEWMSLKSVDGKIPTRSAIYEMKVWRAKKPAYIGSCENLRQKLTLYNLRQNSGHKQLDKFIDRNYNEIQIRYEITPSFDNAKKEVKDRVESFKAQFKNPPAYN